MSTQVFDLPLDFGFEHSFDLAPKKRVSFADEQETSMYWQVPDQQKYLTCLTLNPMGNLVAVASGAKENNLFIYEFDPLRAAPKLTHHQTISLPYIHSMKWVPSTTSIGANGNVLVSGHKNGLVHMTMLPDTYSSDTPAEILTRFNHLYHIGNSTASTRIRQLELVMDGGSLNLIGSICADYVFLWDPSRFDTPKLKLKSRGLNCFNMREGSYIAALGGRKGISIADFRNPGSTLSPPESNASPVTLVKWSPNNDNLVAAVDDKHVVKIWDIRATKPLSAYDGHCDSVTGLEWCDEIPSQLVSSSHDGTIRVWDMNDHKESIKPLQVSPSQKWAQNDSWRMFQDRKSTLDLSSLYHSQANKQPLISQSNRQFVSLELLDHYGAYTIDSSGCFGYHKINNGVPSSPITSASSASDSSENDFSPPSPY